MADISLKNIELVLLQGRKQVLHEFVASVTMENLDALASELANAHGSYIDQLNHAAADLKNPVFMLATVKSSSDKHKLSFHETISVLDALSIMEEKRTLSQEQVEDCAAWLISGYPARQGLNLLTEMASITKPGSVFTSSQKVDEALTAHFTKVSKRPLEWNDFLKVCDWIPKVHFNGTLKSIVAHYKAKDAFEELQHMFAMSYEGKNFSGGQLDIYKEALGTEMTINLSQNLLHKKDVYWALLELKKNLGEESLYSDNFEKTIMDSLGHALPLVPGFIKAICKYQGDLDEWPITAKLMIENYSKVFGYHGAMTHNRLDDFAIKNGLQAELIQEKIKMLRTELISLDEWNYAEMHAKTLAEVFSMGPLIVNHPKREMRYKELLAACKGADMIELKDLLGTVSGAVVMAISDISGGFANKREVMRHYPQAKALFLENDLGM